MSRYGDEGGGFFRPLNATERDTFRAWARENYSPGDTINELWHPVVREECDAINAERDCGCPV